MRSIYNKGVASFFIGNKTLKGPLSKTKYNIILRRFYERKKVNYKEMARALLGGSIKKRKKKIKSILFLRGVSLMSLLYSVVYLSSLLAFVIG